MKLQITNLLSLWKRCVRLPGGKKFFTHTVSWLAPYTGSIGAEVQELSEGKCVVHLKERRAIRNHLNSVHAMALANLGEMTSGLAMLTLLPKGMRGIVTSFHVHYEKKARGLLRAETHCLPNFLQETIDVDCTISNSEGNIVARTTATWKVGKQ